MKSNPDPDDDGALLDAILADEEWAALDSALRRDTMGALRSRRRRKRHQAWAAGFAVVALAAGGVFWRMPRAAEPASPAKQVALAQAPEPCTVVMGNFTEDQLLAMFPKGSCVFAEVDGKRQFFILDEKLAAGVRVQ